MKETKNRLRKFAINELKRIFASGEKIQKEQVIYEKLFDSELWKNSQTIGITLASSFEISTKPIIYQAWRQNKKVFVPKTLPKRKIAFYSFDEQTKVELSSLGIMEPVVEKTIVKENMDLLIVPGLIYNREGYRIGFGGGYYDRFLQTFLQSTCSLSFVELINNDWQPESFDINIQQLFTDDLNYKKKYMNYHINNRSNSNLG